ncbi:dUTP diphosphatase [Clostridium sp. 'White wine YQ']|uniref:dUTP diphosphatase n=1 Tax=Clostridium sp. 'White wine YQ' TaxID=3027474 RepID=UPI002366789E|nr:dUTP diphosphatase [Clostridium sp. 'White wine YQ']MDD7796270.1 dUTP diphosphatase [Clostridium sp. 'White wine YQ']
MNLQKFFNAQEEANNKLIINEKLSDYQLTARRFLALHTKISELANETKCFKFWKDSQEELISRENVMVKYIKCLSCILNIGLDKKYTDLEDIEIRPNDYCLSDQFLNILIDLNDLIISPSQDHYKTLLEDFVSIGISLGYSEKIIEDMFFSDIYSLSR